jgi:hypothetical protein
VVSYEKFLGVGFAFRQSMHAFPPFYILWLCGIKSAELRSKAQNMEEKHAKGLAILYEQLQFK